MGFCVYGSNHTESVRGHEMKKLVILLAIVMLSGCNVIEENKSLKAKNQKLQQRVKELEQVFLKREQDDFQLNTCLELAKANRESAFKLNDTGQKKGSYSIPIPLMQHIQNVYRDECEECYRRYGRR